MQIIKPDVNINFVGSRKIAYAISLIMILTSIVSLIIHGGPKYGIDFAGGAEILAQLEKPASIDTVKAALQSIGLEGSTVQQYGEDRNDYYRILVASKYAESEDLASKIKKAIAAKTGTAVVESSFSFEMVGPQVGRDLREKALMAMFFALLFITVYISGRFELKWLISAMMAIALALAVYALNLLELSIPALMVGAMAVTLVLFWVLNLKYAMGAIVALVHDVTITVGLFSLFAKSSPCPL